MKSFLILFCYLLAHPSQGQQALFEKLRGTWSFSTFEFMYFDQNGAQRSVVLPAIADASITIRNYHDPTAIGNGSQSIRKSHDFTTTSDTLFNGRIIANGVREDVIVYLEDSKLYIAKINDFIEEARTTMVQEGVASEEGKTAQYMLNKMQAAKQQGYHELIYFGEDETDGFGIGIVLSGQEHVLYFSNNSFFLVKSVSQTKLVLLRLEGMAAMMAGTHTVGKDTYKQSQNDIPVIPDKVVKNSSVLTLVRQ